MYEIITGIIDHLWDAEGASATEQQMVYCICGALIICIMLWILDAVSAFIINIGRKGGK